MTSTIQKDVSIVKFLSALAGVVASEGTDTHADKEVLYAVAQFLLPNYNNMTNVITS